MNIYQEEICVKTKGFCDIIDITQNVSKVLRHSNINDGICCLFIPGSTASLTTIEYEPGAVKDLRRFIESLVPQNIHYDHDSRWGDGNGFSHIRASLFRPSLSIPINNNSLTLGTWQQVVIIDFDNRSRDRKVIIKILGL